MGRPSSTLRRPKVVLAFWGIAFVLRALWGDWHPAFGVLGAGALLAAVLVHWAERGRAVSGTGAGGGRAR